MTIATFSREQLLTCGPLSLSELTSRAVEAGVTRARNPEASLLSVIRYREIELLDGRWTTPRWLLEGRCLTAPHIPYRTRWYGEVDADLGLLGTELPAPTPTSLELVEDPSRVVCLRVTGGEVEISTIRRPDTDTLEVAALTERVAAITPESRYGDQRRSGLRAVAQLMVDDPSAFRTPLPPLSTWVPALVEDARSRAEEEQRMIEWHQEDERRRRREVVLDDCTAIEVELAAERAGMSIREWVNTAIDRAITAEPRRLPQPGGVVVSLGDRWR